jgi:ubiquinone/menaquinone biosynthesis C-methylase UbiE
MELNRLDKVWEPWLEKGDYQADFAMRRLNRQRFYQLIARYVKNNARVLEVGCGTGIDTNLLAAEFKQAKFYATDISAKGVLLANRISGQLGNGICFVQGDINRLHFKDGAFDVIFSQGVLEHFPEPVRVIKEQARVLKDEGVLIISVPQKYTAYTLMKKIKLYRKTWEWEWETEYSHRGLKKLGSECGLKEIEAVGYQYWRSWWEPAWVLRDFYDKFHRRIPFENKTPFSKIKKHYDRLWCFLEQKWGVYFLQNLAVVFMKDKQIK